MRIGIDKETCTGCGVCESLCPDVFQIQEDEKAHVINLEACNESNCKEAADSCPTQAIIIED
ncbi:MAG: ferredoxin [bacterium]|nr:ferredoxin [bacterium]MDD5530294.1 ferredoxin [bacterium]